MNDIDLFIETDKIYQNISKTIHFVKFKNKPQDLLMIICKAKQLGISPFDAVNGALFCVNGIIEMTARTMNSLIRSKGHSIQIVESTSSKCVLRGKRADNGDVSDVEFTVEEAKQAGLLHKDNWRKYTKDMLFARALSRLARQLFADVVLDVYIEGEIDAPLKKEEPIIELISEEQIVYLESLIGDNEQILEKVSTVLKNCGYQSIKDIQKKDFARFETGIKSLMETKNV